MADCRYDVLLGMPWLVDSRPNIDYEPVAIRVGDLKLDTIKDRSGSIKVHNLGVKKFRSLLRKKKRNTEDFMFFQVRSVNHLASVESKRGSN